MHQAISFTPWDDTQAQLRSLACSNVEVPETKPCASRRASCFTLGFRDPLGSKDVWATATAAVLHVLPGHEDSGNYPKTSTWGGRRPTGMAAPASGGFLTGEVQRPVHEDDGGLVGGRPPPVPGRGIACQLGSDDPAEGPHGEALLPQAQGGEERVEVAH